MPDLPRAALRDAARLGLQSAVAGAGGWLLAEASGLDTFTIVMMAVTSLQRSVGGTWGEALLRLESAAAGSLIGLLCLALLPPGWGTATALALSLGVIGAATTFRSAWALAVLPAVAMSLGDPDALLETAATISAAIAAGAALGALVAFLVWPDAAEARFERHFRAALRATADRLAEAVRAVAGTPAGPEAAARWSESVWLAGESVGQARFADREGMTRRLDALRRLHEAVVILDRAAEAERAPGAALRPEAEALAREACAALQALAEGRRPDAAPLDRGLDAVEAALGRDPAPAGPHHARDAVAFGLHEVRRSLDALLAA